MKLTSRDHQIFNEVIYDDRIRKAIIKKIELIDPIKLLKSKFVKYKLNVDSSNEYLVDVTGFFMGEESNPEAKFSEVVLNYIIHSIFINNHCSKVRTAYILASSESIPIEGRFRYTLTKNMYVSPNGGKFTTYQSGVGISLEFNPDTLMTLIEDITSVQSIAEYIVSELKSNLFRHWLNISNGESYMFHHKVNLDYNQIILELIIGLDSPINRDLSSTPKDDISIELNHIVNEILNS